MGLKTTAHVRANLGNIRFQTGPAPRVLDWFGIVGVTAGIMLAIAAAVPLFPVVGRGYKSRKNEDFLDWSHLDPRSEAFPWVVVGVAWIVVVIAAVFLFEIRMLRIWICENGIALPRTFLGMGGIDLIPFSGLAGWHVHQRARWAGRKTKKDKRIGAIGMPFRVPFYSRSAVVLFSVSSRYQGSSSGFPFALPGWVYLAAKDNDELIRELESAMADFEGEVGVDIEANLWGRMLKDDHCKLCVYDVLRKDQIPDDAKAAVRRMRAHEATYAG